MPDTMPTKTPMIKRRVCKPSPLYQLSMITTSPKTFIDQQRVRILIWLQELEFSFDDQLRLLSELQKDTKSQRGSDQERSSYQLVESNTHIQHTMEALKEGKNLKSERSHRQASRQKTKIPHLIFKNTHRLYSCDI